MSRQSEFFARLKQIASLAAGIPSGAEVTVEWSDAPPDLLLTLALTRQRRTSSHITHV